MFRSQKIALASLMFVVFCFGFVVDAQADTIIFQPTRASFNAASPSQTILTFEGIAPAGGATSSSSSRTVGGVTFSNTFGGSPSSSVQIYDAGYSSGEYSLNSGATLVSPVGSFNSGSLQFVTTVTLPTGGATAIGMDLGYGTIAPITVTLSNGTQQTVVLTGPVGSSSTGYVISPVFFGFTSNVPITSLSFSTTINGSFALRIDNFSFGNASLAPSAVPEPATIFLFSTGLTSMATILRRCQRKEKTLSNL